jgi:hypothetical protein
MRCIAYRASGNCIHTWRPCRGRAEKHSMFCLSHIRAICGAYLGLWAHGFPERMNGRKSSASAGSAGSRPQ